MVNYTCIWFPGNKGEPKCGIIDPSLEPWLRWHCAIENKSKKLNIQEKNYAKTKKGKEIRY